MQTDTVGTSATNTNEKLGSKIKDDVTGDVKRKR